MTYSDDFLEQVRAVSPMETIAGNYVNLIRRGRHYVCNCPFHSEKTPSCTIFPDTQSFYCFGCGAGGDVFSWIRRIEGMEFPDAVKFLAEKAGLQVPNDREAQQRAKMRMQILAINREAANFYFQNLISGSDKRGLEYLMQRRLKAETIRKYGLGYAPDNWAALTDHLLQKGFQEDELVAANISHRSSKNSLYDVFRCRVMFPIVDTRGAVIGFGGRVMDDSQPKYLNTAKTPIFDKGRNLFSLNFAKDSNSTSIILAEGYMDVVAIHQAGFSNVVATLGTAITPEQARKLAQYAKEIIIAYDSDGAGQQATQKAINRFSEAGLPTRILHMTDAKDPDEYIRKFGRERFRLLLEQAGDATNFRLDRCELGLDTTTEAGKVQLLKRLVRVLAEIRDPLEREVYLSRTAHKWEISADILKRQVEQQLRMQRRLEQNEQWHSVMRSATRPKQNQSQTSEQVRESHAAERLVCYILAHSSESAWAVKAVNPQQITDPVYAKVFTFFQEQDKISPLTLSSLGSVLTDEEMSIITGSLIKQQDLIVTKQEAEDCIRILKQMHTTQIENDDDLISLIQKKKDHPGYN